MKRLLTLIVLSAVLLFAVSCVKQTKQQTGNDVNPNPFSNQNIEITCDNDDKLVVKGSFDCSEASYGEYSVEYFVVRDNDEAKALEMTKKYKLEAGVNTFEQTIPVVSKDTLVKVSVKTENETICDPYEKSFKFLRILSIGNSFSVDAQQWLYGIAKDAGYDRVVLGNLYVGGCSLATHSNNLFNNKPAYIYYKNDSGEWTETPDTTMLFGITDENWDYITLQQQSGNSGLAATYDPYLANVIKYVNENKTNPKAELLWHMTWAYAGDCTLEGFADYDYDQMKMYESIVGAVQEKVLPNFNISFVLPVGTAIQNARASYLGDTLCRDGFHLDYNYGRYLAGLTWIHKITGMPIDDIDYIPENAFDEECLDTLKACAKAAVENPYEVTVINAE